ncbi:hypothetical protein [Sandaracinus amylolyticus]|uniref:hypothetical protein n=1 Tax=Sandaracinus amylolyticus TaxID=927083 RepID=UPI001F158367|nr:hypothetical protein [Sandaracinus amylolyticus]
MIPIDSWDVPTAEDWCRGHGFRPVGHGVWSNGVRLVHIEPMQHGGALLTEIQTVEAANHDPRNS